MSQSRGAQVDVLQPGSQRKSRVGADGSVERAPVVQRKREHAEVANFGCLTPHHQRQDARRAAFVQNDHRAETLPVAKMPPIDLQPFQRLKERRPGSLPQQFPPLAAELGQPLNFVDFQHLGHGKAYVMEGRSPNILAN